MRGCQTESAWDSSLRALKVMPAVETIPRFFVVYGRDGQRETSLSQAGFAADLLGPALNFGQRGGVDFAPHLKQRNWLRVAPTRLE
jgi:hypothetical protein